MSTSGPPGFRLLRLQVRDFRGIDSLTLDFTDGNGDPLQLAVLAADNGGGKTAVLEAILLLLARDDLLPADTAPQAEQVRFGAKTFDMTAELRVTTAGGSEDGTASRRSIPSSHMQFVQEFISNGPDGQLMWPAPAGWSWSYRGVHWPSVEYFSARREPEELGATPGPKGARSSAESRRLVELKRRLISTYYRSLRSSKGSATPDEATPFARLQRFWSRFSRTQQTLDVIPVSNNPGSGDEVVLRAADLPVPADITSLEQARELAPARRDIPRMVPLDRLSSGEIALFAFSGPLVFRDRPADLILIDEPEQHLHGKWQARLLPALRELSPTSQFIVATHSAEILEAALSYERYILVPDSDPRAQPNGNEAGGAAPDEVGEPK
jgi:predicted ATPase